MQYYFGPLCTVKIFIRVIIHRCNIILVHYAPLKYSQSLGQGTIVEEIQVVGCKLKPIWSLYLICVEQAKKSQYLFKIFIRVIIHRCNIILVHYAPLKYSQSCGQGTIVEDIQVVGCKLKPIWSVFNLCKTGKKITISV